MRGAAPAALLLTLALVSGGCASGGDGGDGGGGGDATGSSSKVRTAESEKAGDAAAAQYVGDLRAWSAQLSQARATRKVLRDRTKAKVWPDLSDVLADPPTLKKVDGSTKASTAYAAADEVAARVGAMQAELVALQSADSALTRAGKNLYLDYLTQYGVALDLSSALFAKLQSLGLSDLDQNRAERRRLQITVPKAYRVSLKKQIAALNAYKAKLDKISYPGALGDSVTSYIDEELAVGSALLQEFEDYLRATPPRQANVGLYNKRTPQIDTNFDRAPRVAYDNRGTLTKGLVDGIATLAEQAGAGALEADAPVVGDPYRALVLALSTKRPKVVEQGRWLVDQLWVLHRIREIEKTPEATYQAARATISAQETGTDPRNYYSTLLSIFVGSDALYFSTFLPGEVDRAATYAAWAEEQLARPAPPILDPTRRQLLAAIKTVPTSGSQESRSTAYFDFRRDAEKIMTRGARLLDRAKTMRPAVSQAVAATRPAPAS